MKKRRSLKEGGTFEIKPYSVLLLLYNNNNVHLYSASAIFQSIIRKLNSLSIEALTAKPS